MLQKRAFNATHFTWLRIASPLITDRLDNINEWPLDEDKGMYGPLQRVVIELKILRGDLEKTIQEGLEQTSDYADRSDAHEAHLMIFNRDRKVSWDQKIFKCLETYQGREIVIWRA